jgi:hypothetical protein
LDFGLRIEECGWWNPSSGIGIGNPKSKIQNLKSIAVGWFPDADRLRYTRLIYPGGIYGEVQ